MHFRLSRLLLTILILASFSALLPSAKASSQETLRPNAVGDSSQCTPFGGSGPNWDCVNEASSDGDTSYVRSPSTDSLPRLDLYNIDASTVPEGSTINYVTVYALCRSLSNTYKAYFEIALKRPSQSIEYGSANQPTTTYTLYNSVFTTVAQTDLANLQIGIRIESGDNDPLFAPGRCTQVYAVIDYDMPAQGGWNNVSVWSHFLVTRSWQGSGTWSDFVVARMWLNSGVWSDSLISRSWQNIEVWNVNLLTIGWKTIATWSILLLGEDATTIIVILFLFSVVACIGLGLYRKKKKS